MQQARFTGFARAFQFLQAQGHPSRSADLEKVPVFKPADRVGARLVPGGLAMTGEQYAALGQRLGRLEGEDFEFGFLEMASEMRRDQPTELERALEAETLPVG